MIKGLTIPKYLLGGVLNTALSYLIFVIVFSESKSVLLSLLLVSLIGTTLSFIYNKRIVFMKSHRNSLSKFVSLQILIIATNWIILHIVSKYSISRIATQFFLAGMFALFNYLVSSRYIFVETI